MFEIKFETANAAFHGDDDEGREEVARILDVVAQRVRDGYGDGAIRDVNGNTVGRWDMALND